MSRCVKYRREEYLIVQNNHKSKAYYTVINTKLNTHIHLNCGIKTAKVLVARAITQNTKGLNEFMKNKLEILLGNNADWNICHSCLVKVNTSHNIY
jgi:hypothetical protein